MKRHSALLLLFMFCASLTASAQSISVFDVDASAFPTMKAKFYALRSDGRRQTPSAQDITITENGVPRTTLSVDCPAFEPQALSAVLVVDCSGSMARGAGIVPNITLAQDAAQIWVQGVPPGNSECAIVSFDDASYYVQDFTSDQQKLMRAIGLLGPDGGTDYDQALLLGSGGLRVTEHAKYKKIIVMLTDGLPNEPPQVDAIIAEAKRQNCRIYASTLSMRCPQVLKDICTQTGGAWFESITQASDAREIFGHIQELSQDVEPCEITWMSGASCDTSTRMVTFHWQGYSCIVPVTPPPSASARLSFAPSTMFIRSKQPGVRFDTTISVTAVNGTFTVTNVTSTNPAFDVNPKSFTLASGGNRTLTVSFTPADSNYTTTEFDFASDVCPQTYVCSGGFPGHKPKSPTIKLLVPNGGEQLVAGSDTVITWTGIPISDTVALEYSTDDGASWQLITERATGGRFAWHVPATPSNRCTVRVSQLSSNFTDGWAVNAPVTPTSTVGSEGKSVATDINGNIYVTGSGSGTLNFGAGVTLPPGSYLIKYLPDNSIDWAVSVGGTSEAVAVDHAGNIYVAGECGRSTTFDSITVTFPGAIGNYIAKYYPNGRIDWVRTANGPQTESALGIALDSLGDVYLIGEFQDTISFAAVGLKGLTTSSYYLDNYLACYRTDGAFVWAHRAGRSYGTSAARIAADPQGNVYAFGKFDAQADFGGITITAKQMQNTFLAKYRSDGTVEWAQGVGSSTSLPYMDVAADGNGNIYLTSDFVGWFHVGTDSVRANGGSAAYLAHYRNDGAALWCKVAGGSGDDHGMGVSLDARGNIYLLGSTTTPAHFDTMTFVGPHQYNLFAAQYLPSGDVSWVRLADVTERGYHQDIAADPAGHVYVCGGYSLAPAVFDGTKLSWQGEGPEMFLWRIGMNGRVQSDTSDNLFSIVMPQPLSEDVDMGRVLVASGKDSIVANFVQNIGSYPFAVDSIVIAGTDASQFSMVSPIPPFGVTAASAEPVEFRFQPTSAGVKTAQVMIITQADTLRQTITGEGITPTIAIDGDVIDFGQVAIGTTKDTTIAVAIKNIGGTLIQFAAATQLGPDIRQFSVVSGGGPFSLAPGASQTVTLRFSPTWMGRTGSRIGFPYAGVGSPALLRVMGQGLGGLIRIPDDSGYAGDRRSVPVLLENVPIASALSVATNFRLRVMYDPSVLFPDVKNIAHGDRFDTVTVTGTLGADSVLGRIPFVAMLGKAPTSPMSIVDFQWLDGSGNPADYDAETESGTFTLLGLCPAGGTRLFDPTGDVQIVHVSPNPTNTTITVDINTLESGRTRLRVMNLLGEIVTTLYDGELKPGAHSFRFDAATLAAGSYYLTLRTPTVDRLERIDIVK